MLKKFMNTRFKLLKNQKGMTLIELLAVVVVLGIISAIAVPAIAGTISNQKKSADTSSEDVIKEAALRYLYDTDPQDATPTTSVGVSSVLLANGYLSSSFSPKKQADSTKYFSTVTVAYDATTGWSVTSVNEAATTG